MTTHTDPPWQIYNDIHGAAYVGKSKDGLIASVYLGARSIDAELTDEEEDAVVYQPTLEQYAEREANARVIAAAPAMLEAIRANLRATDFGQFADATDMMKEAMKLVDGKRETS